jgi:proteasome lid subunit RPN8/RPN11
MSVSLSSPQIAELFAHAQRVAPEECCGLLGGAGEQARSVYPLRNVAPDAQRAYEAAPEDLFAAQRRMRECGETLLGIYHSHPRQARPVPSATDVRLAFYPSAVCFIIGLGGESPVLSAFCLDPETGSWQAVEYKIEAE